MGIYISLNVSKSVTAEEWKPVYEKSLLMAQKAGLYDIGFRMIHGERINCIYMTEEIVPDDEKDEIRQRRYTGWSAVGSIPSYCRAETQFMPKYTRGNEEGEKTDALLSIVSDSDDELWWQVWGNKTQGEPYHMVLLAIGCMAEQELGIQAIVDGDITYGQCVSAARLASELLETEIKPPIRCRWIEFADRVKNLKGLDDTGKLEFLMQYYLGRKDNNMGEYIRSHFSDDVILSFWQKRFQNIKINTYGFQDEMKSFFLLGYDLSLFCSIINLDRNDTEQCKQLINIVLNSSMHIRDKNCADIMDLSESSQPYGIYSVLASMVFRGAKNPAIDRHIPIDEMREVFSRCFGNVVDVNSVINEYLNKAEPSDQEAAHQKFTSMIEKQLDDEEEKYEEYDICDYKDLVQFSPECRIHPKMTEALKKSFEFYCSMAERDACQEMLTKSADDMFHYLAKESQGRVYYLTEIQWNKIYDELHRDSSAFKRYYPMVCVKVNGDLEYITRAFVGDDLFWNYCCSHFLNCNN